MSATTSVNRSFGFARAIVGVAIAAAVAVFGVIQLASYALDSAAAVAGTLPTRVPIGFGLAVYRFLDRVAPAPYVESTLAAHALETGDLEAAQKYALRLPASPTRDELLARIALARGETALALEYFIAAPDVAAVDRSVVALAGRDPAAAAALEEHLKDRLVLLETHPDAVADAYWQMGDLDNRQAWRRKNASAKRALFADAMTEFERAVSLAPLSEKYVIAAANQADLLGNEGRARELFAQGVDIDPGSADAMAGLGVVAFRRGDTAAARSYLARATALDPHSPMVGALRYLLR